MSWVPSRSAYPTTFRAPRVRRARSPGLVEPPGDIGPGSRKQLSVAIDVQYVMAAPGFCQLQDLSRLTIDSHVPAVRFVRYIAVLGADPQSAVAERNRRNLAEMVPLPQIPSVQIEALQPGVVAVGHINDSLV